MSQKMIMKQKIKTIHIFAAVSLFNQSRCLNIYLLIILFSIITRKTKLYKYREMSFQTFQQQIQQINYIQTYLQSLSHNRLTHLVNQEYYLQSSAHKPSNQEPPLAAKILKLISEKSSDSADLIDKLEYRLRVMLDHSGDVMQQIKEKYGKDRQKIKQSGLKVEDFREVFESEEMGHDEGKLTKNLRSIFENEQEMGLDDFLDLFVKEIEEQTHNEEDGSDEESIQEQILYDLDKLVEEIDCIGKMFSF